MILFLQSTIFSRCFRKAKVPPEVIVADVMTTPL